MNKVSKSIKKYRMAANLTQSELADKLFVTRQAVSSWENGRTQPDIESLGLLSQALSVSIEELIYGEKPKLVDDGKNEIMRKTMITIFSILASLLVGVGGVLVFVNYWEEFSSLLKMILSVVPMLIGQAAGVFVILKKNDKVSWREGASVLWCAGVAATVWLSESMFSLINDPAITAFIMALLFIPVMFVLDSVAPMIVIYITAAVSGGDKLSYPDEGLIGTVILLVPFVLGALFCFVHRRDEEDARTKYAVWITVLYFAAAAIIIDCELFGYFLISPLVAVFMFIYIFKNSGILSDVCRIVPTIALPVLSVIITLLLRPTEYPDYYLDELTLYFKDYLRFIISIALAIMALIVLLRKNKDGKSGIFFIASTFLIFISDFIGLPEELSGKMSVYIIVFIFAMVQGVSLVSIGARENRFLPLNVGLLTIIALIMEIVFAQDIDTLIIGFIMIFFGACLFVINYRLARKGKNEITEATADEKE